MLLRTGTLSTLIVCLFTMTAIGQVNQHYDHVPDSLVKGIYWSYRDLIRNLPYYRDEFQILYANNARLRRYRFPEWERFYDVNTDRVAYLKDQEQRFKDASYFFGYCDGENIFISFKRFHRLNILGPISLIHVVEAGSKSDYGVAGVAGGLVGVAIAAAIDEGGGMGKVDDWFILDLYSGLVNPIHPIYLSPLFRRNDKELYQEFKKTKKRGNLETMIEFVIRFNERNPMPEP